MKKHLVSFGKTAAVTGAFLIPLMLISPRVAQGVFGFGDVVFDPTSYAELGTIAGSNASTLTKTIEEVEQTVKILTNAMQMYQLSMAVATSFDSAHKLQWITLAQSALGDYTADKYGENDKWAKMLNGNPQLAAQAWQAATMPIGNTSFMSGQIPGQSKLLANLATVNQIDGGSTKCLQIVSNYYGNSLMNLAPILKLAIDRATGSDKDPLGLGTESGNKQLDILNAQAEQANHMHLDSGQMQSCLVQQQLLANKIQRDQIAESINFAGELNGYQTTEDLNWGNSAATISNYRPQ